MSMTPLPKQRKPTATRLLTLAARREADRARRDRARPAAQRAQRARRQYAFRLRVVRTYRAWRRQEPERRAVARTCALFPPTHPSQRPLTPSTVRRWARLVRQGGWTTLFPRSTRPHTIG